MAQLWSAGRIIVRTGKRLHAWSDKHYYLTAWICFGVVVGAIGAGVGHHWPTKESFAGGVVGAAIGFVAVSAVILYLWMIDHQREMEYYRALDNETWAEAGLYPYPPPPDA